MCNDPDLKHRTRLFKRICLHLLQDTLEAQVEIFNMFGLYVKFLEHCGLLKVSVIQFVHASFPLRF